MSLQNPRQHYTPTSVTRGVLGKLQIVMTSTKGIQRDVTYLRDVPTIVESFSNADPFGDASAVITMPQVSTFEAWGSGDLAMLDDWSGVSIYRVYSGTKKLLWRGFIASYDVEDQSPGIRLSCMGAMYQLDLYVKRPYYYEDIKKTASMIIEEFKNRPHLRMNANVQVVPAGKYDTLFGSDTIFKTRNHGAWERVLTGYVQDQLTAMVDADTNRQWTLTHDDSRRRPVFQLRGDPATTVTWTVDLGAPGVSVDLSKDLLQSVNVIYGEGTDEARNTWRHAVEAVDGSFTDYRPLAYDPQVHVEPINPKTFRTEAFYNFGNGFGLDDAQIAARKFVGRDREAGWVGTIKLASDPHEGNRLDIRAGDKVVLRNFRGEDTSLHIASVTADLEDDGFIVSLKVDQRERDLLTLEEVIARNRDAKTPSRLLQIGHESTTINDTEVPWDYDAGSGFVPTPSKELPRETSTGFPYTDLTVGQYSPRSRGEYFVYVNGAATNREDRWKFVKVLLSEQGSIRYTEFALYDEYGNAVAAPFHVSIYPENFIAPNSGSHTQMPRDDDGPSPFLTDAFRSIEGVDSRLNPHPQLIIGWGDGDQKAGYWPGLESEGDPVTGKLVDESTWQYSLDRGHKYVTLAIYAEVDCYVMGRMVKADTMPERPIVVGDG